MKWKIFAKKNTINEIFTKKKFFEKKNSKKILKRILPIFLYLKKNSVEIRLIIEKKIKKNFENNSCNLFIFEKKSVKSRLIHQSKDRKFSVEMSVILG